MGRDMAQGWRMGWDMAQGWRRDGAGMAYGVVGGAGMAYDMGHGAGIVYGMGDGAGMAYGMGHGAGMAYGVGHGAGMTLIIVMQCEVGYGVVVCGIRAGTTARSLVESETKQTSASVPLALARSASCVSSCRGTA